MGPGLPTSGQAAADDETELFVKVGARPRRPDFDEVLHRKALATYSVIVTKTHQHSGCLARKALTERRPFHYLRRAHRRRFVITRRMQVIDDQLLRLGF